VRACAIPAVDPLFSWLQQLQILDLLLNKVDDVLKFLFGDCLGLCSPLGLQENASKEGRVNVSVASAVAMQEPWA
jgi:hypothetical protein